MSFRAGCSRMYSASARMPNEIRVLLTVPASEGKTDCKCLEIPGDFRRRSVFSVCDCGGGGFHLFVDTPMRMSYLRSSSEFLAARALTSRPPKRARRKQGL